MTKAMEGQFEDGFRYCSLIQLKYVYHASHSTVTFFGVIKRNDSLGCARNFLGTAVLT